MGWPSTRSSRRRGTTVNRPNSRTAKGSRSPSMRAIVQSHSGTFRTTQTGAPPSAGMRRQGFRTIQAAARSSQARPRTVLSRRIEQREEEHMVKGRAGSAGVERDILKFLEALAAGDGKPMEQMTPTEARAVLVGAQSSVPVVLRRAEVSERTITAGGLPVRVVIVRPAGVPGELPAFMFFHGG